MEEVKQDAATQELVKVERAVKGIVSIRQGLEELKTNVGGFVYDFERDPGAMQLAVQHRNMAREPRIEVERIRIEAKRFLLKLGKDVDGAAALITAEIAKIEEPIQKQIDAEKKRQDDAKQARIDAENARIAKHRAVLDDLRGSPMRLIGKSVAELQAEKDRIVLVLLPGNTSDLPFEEFTQTIFEAHEEALRQLSTMIEQRIELERLQVEREEYERKEQTRLVAERARKAVEEAEQRERDRKIEEERKAEREASDKQLADARAELDRQRAVLEAAQKKLREDAAAAAIATENLKREAAATLKREEEERLDQERKAALARMAPATPRGNPGADAIIAAVMNVLDVGEALVVRWLSEIDWEARRDRAREGK